MDKSDFIEWVKRCDAGNLEFYLNGKEIVLDAIEIPVTIDCDRLNFKFEGE